MLSPVFSRDGTLGWRAGRVSVGAVRGWGEWGRDERGTDYVEFRRIFGEMQDRRRAAVCYMIADDG